MELASIVSQMVRVGVVSVVDEEKRVARVVYQGDGLVSGWLAVLQHPLCGVEVPPDGGHTPVVYDTFTGGGSADAVPHHNHEGTLTTFWMPQVNDVVLVLTLPVFNGDGYIVGVIC